MSNILLDELPTTFQGYEVNTDFRIGIQLMQLFEDESYGEYQRILTMKYLLFSDIDKMRPMPQDDESFQECLSWFLGGWNMDNTGTSEKKEKVMDYDVDQGRIYADFIQIYGINLNAVEYMHWWEFQWLLWNMPHDRSSFLQAIEIRTKKPRKGASREEIKAIQEGKKVYGLKQRKEKYSSTEKAKIDDVDRKLRELKKGS